MPLRHGNCAQTWGLPMVFFGVRKPIRGARRITLCCSATEGVAMGAPTTAPAVADLWYAASALSTGRPDAHSGAAGMPGAQFTGSG